MTWKGMGGGGVGWKVGGRMGGGGDEGFRGGGVSGGAMWWAGAAGAALPARPPPRGTTRARTHLDMRVAPDLGQVQAGQRLLGQHLHPVAAQRLLHRLHDAVDLRDAQQRRALQLGGAAVALRQAPRHQHGLAQGPRAPHQRAHRRLGGPLDGAAVDQPEVGVGRGAVFKQPEAVLGQLPRHVLGIRAVVRAAKGLQPDLLRAGDRAAPGGGRGPVSGVGGGAAGARRHAHPCHRGGGDPLRRRGAQVLDVVHAALCHR
jgi:hypothetical protein